MDWYELSHIKTAQTQPDLFSVRRSGNSFYAYLGTQQIGQAFLSTHGDGRFLLNAIDINEDQQRQGYGTRLMQVIGNYLKSVNAVSLSSSNEGSGTVQILDKVFGRENVKHFHGGQEIDFERAKHVMDVDYGYTGSKVSLRSEELSE
jgi:hypothetical protein